MSMLYGASLTRRVPTWCLIRRRTTASTTPSVTPRRPLPPTPSRRAYWPSWLRSAAPRWCITAPTTWWTAPGEISWYGYARAIFVLAGVEADLSPTTAADYGAPARRPSYSILDNSKLESVGIARPRPWRDALAEYLRMSR